MEKEIEKVLAKMHLHGGKAEHSSPEILKLRGAQWGLGFRDGSGVGVGLAYFPPRPHSKFTTWLGTQTPEGFLFHARSLPEGHRKCMV